jgi:hypothetical protein
VLDWLRLARHQAVDSYLPDSDTVRDSCLAEAARILKIGRSTAYAALAAT